MEAQEIYELVYEATKAALAEHQGGTEPFLARRMEGGRVVFEDNQGRMVKEVTAEVVFRKVTAVRERIRVLEQKINAQEGISDEDRVDLQGLITRAYGSLTTFNFLFQDPKDHFRGQGS